MTSVSVKPKKQERDRLWYFKFVCPKPFLLDPAGVEKFNLIFEENLSISSPKEGEQIVKDFSCYGNVTTFVPMSEDDLNSMMKHGRVRYMYAMPNGKAQVQLIEVVDKALKGPGTKFMFGCEIRKPQVGSRW